MYASQHVAPSSAVAAAVATLSIHECDRDEALVSTPRPEVHVVVRFGPSSPRGLDAHVFGARERAHRKIIRRGQRAVTARLRLGAAEAVLGVPASAMAGRIVPLHDVWGDGEAERLLDRLADAPDTASAAAVLERALAERASRGLAPSARLVLEAADRLGSANVNAVAEELGVSERHLRRVFRETVGVSPKAFAKLARFHRALRAARASAGASWASIAVDAGYYDQAHLIAEFRAIAGTTPRALLAELARDPSFT